VTVRTMLHVRDVTKAYRGTIVLDGISLEVAAGEAVALVGANGAGKSTLLRVCAGVQRADRGTVRRGGRVGYAPQEPGLKELLTAGEHLDLFAPTAPEAAASMLRDLGFPGDQIGSRLVRDLSGGNRQKLNLALALVGDPRVLLLDEPYQGFDLGSYLDFWTHVNTWRSEGALLPFYGPVQLVERAYGSPGAGTRLGRAGPYRCRCGRARSGGVCAVRPTPACRRPLILTVRSGRVRSKDDLVEQRRRESRRRGPRWQLA
jgi:ABC-2 type transport system ATP-binding protein